MAIASAVAVAAISFLAVDAGVVNSGVVTKPIATARATIADAAASQHQLAFAVQTWARRGHQNPAVEECLAID
jgi:hypothetical protein